LPIGVSAAVLVLCGLPSTALRADDLDRQLLAQAPALLKHLRERGCRNVGVLKFRVKKDGDPISDNAGPLNQSVARRLEIALVLANDFQQPLGIIQDASAVAARLKGANHLNAEGRHALFAGRYPLAWGDEDVTADAFLTGIVHLDSARGRMTVGVVRLDRNGGALEKVAELSAATTSANLVESGASFLLRGVFDDGKVVETRLAATKMAEAKALEAAAEVQKKERPHPLQDPAAPVALEVLYNGRPVGLEVRDGRAWVLEPGEGQKVAFRVRRQGNSRERYGVVLKVNGENTLYRERQPDLNCTRWILDPGDRPLTIDGFQMSGNKAEAFRVLSREASKKDEMDYGADVGTVSLTVFREKRGKDQPALLTEVAEDEAALARAAFPRERPKDLALLKQRLREGGGGDEQRGLVVPGGQIESGTQRVKFRAAPTPVLSATVTYYRR
jgi:hypothetical protein